MDGDTIMSEQTKDMSPEELAALQEKVTKMTEDELTKFRNGFDPDEMGYHGEECLECQQ